VIASVRNGAGEDQDVFTWRGGATCSRTAEYPGAVDSCGPPEEGTKEGAEAVTEEGAEEGTSQSSLLNPSSSSHLSSEDGE
jgi:hypothetical protein